MPSQTETPKAKDLVDSVNGVLDLLVGEVEFSATANDPGKLEIARKQIESILTCLRALDAWCTLVDGQLSALAGEVSQLRDRVKTLTGTPVTSDPGEATDTVL